MKFRPWKRLREWNQTRRFQRCVRRTGFWYVDIPRTGSSWLRDLLFHSYGWPHGKASFLNPGLTKKSAMFLPAHTSAATVCQAAGQDLWKSLFTFSVVRNPFDRIASLYLYYKNTEKIFMGDFPQFCAAIETSCCWVSEHRFRPPLWTSQKKYLADNQGKFLVRHIGRYEKYDDFIMTLRRQLDLGEASAAIINPSLGKPETGLSGLHSKKTAEFIAEFFVEDFEAFDYPKRLP